MTQQIEWRDPDDLEPYEKNPRKNLKAVKRVADSIREFGFNQPIVVDAEDIIVVGHTRWKASKELGLTEVPVLRMPEGISDEKVRAYRIADNKLNELATWDEDLLQEELLDLRELTGDIELTGFKSDELDDMLKTSDDFYTQKVDTPIYEIKGERPECHQLYDNDRAQQLVADIERSNVPEDIAVFLRLAAHRHTAFDYGRIAEFYAHADPDVQRLMEDSALVVIDFDRAVELGYTSLRDEIADIYLESAENEG